MVIITKNPRDEVYKKLIDLAFDICDEFILVIQTSGLRFSQNAQTILDKLKGSLIEVKERPREPHVFEYHYRTSIEARNLVKKVSVTLYSWLQPGLPEDLGFLKNGKPWLINIAHERYSAILTDDPSEISRIKSLPGLEINYSS
jgi:hypothetical protein